LGVLTLFPPVVVAGRDAPAPPRDRSAAGLRQFMDILGIEDSDGLPAFYLGLYS
jgi:hypothetical protein